MPVICFHNADEENGYLSNWYPSTFTLKGIDFSSMEQYMMYRKAICFDDDKVAAQILATEDVAEIKALGRLVAGYDENLWNGVRQIVVYEGLLAKFSQNPELKERLKSTGSAVLFSTGCFPAPASHFSFSALKHYLQFSHNMHHAS